MEPSNPKLEQPLDIFGQNPRLSRLYTQLCFCFPISDSHPRVKQQVTNHLQLALDSLSTSFPWVAGQVIQDDDGVFKIVPLSNNPELIIRHAEDHLPSYSEYRDAGFPFKWLHEKGIAPRNAQTLPTGLEGPAPVLALQATFVNGGMLLVFSGQHNCMDMAGMCEAIRLFSKACRTGAGGEAFIGEEVRVGNLRGGDVIPLLDEAPAPERSVPVLASVPSSLKEKEEIEGVNVNKEEREDEDVKATATWSYFHFPRTALTTLKSLAMDTLSPGIPYISTDDALSAFLWRHITKARLPRLELQGTPSSTNPIFERQVDVRKHLALPPTYTGNAVHKVSTTVPVTEVADRPLGYLASALRASLQPTPDLGYHAREAATMLHRTFQSQSLTHPPSPNSANENDTKRIRPKVNPTDIKMSSWAKERCYDFDFGLLGKPEAVRRPAFDAWEGLAYCMPKDREGGIAVAVCLRESDLRALRGDESWGGLARWVG